MRSFMAVLVFATTTHYMLAKSQDDFDADNLDSVIISPDLLTSVLAAKNARVVPDVVPYLPFTLLNVTYGRGIVVSTFSGCSNINIPQHSVARGCGERGVIIRLGWFFFFVVPSQNFLRDREDSATSRVT